jgi:DNA ligase-1
MSAAPITLAYPWTNQRVRGYWLSEKLDGVRGYWTGRELLSRNGKPIPAPSWFLAVLPAGLALDGELWAGRGCYGMAMGACKSATHPAWPEMRFAAFDLPHHPGTFEERQAALNATGLAQLSRAVVALMPPQKMRAPSAGLAFPVLVVPQEVCQGLHHLKRRLREVADQGGEGMMLRAAGSRYVAGRSHDLLKVRIANNWALLSQGQRLAA